MTEYTPGPRWTLDLAVKDAIANRWRTLSSRILALLLVTLMCSGGMSAYSVLTHEEIVDLLWTDQIRPLILQRYPGLSEEQIKEAHAYAYGGAMMRMSTHLRWAHCPTMRRTSPAIPRSTVQSPSNTLSCKRSLARQCGMRRTKPRI